jgi:hypothetical protein
MILTIDNLDGRGAVDYSAALSADAPLKIERTLNAPSRCSGSLVLTAEPALTVPVRRARVIASSDAGTVLFTGYLATEPVAEYAGAGLAGPAYRIALDAVSDEWLLDKQSLTLSGDGFAVAGGSLLAKLAARTAVGQLNTAAITSGNSVGVFAPQPGQPWSTNAAGIAAGSYAAYRAIAGGLSMQTVGSVTHTLDFDSGDGGGTLQFASLKTAMVKELANDVTLSGEIEPGAFVTEMFPGDGTTSVFQLSEAPFRVAKPTLLSDGFNHAAIDAQTWNITDPGSHLSLGGGGLTMSGGTGADGQTVLAAIDQVELGGSLVVEAASVQLTLPSDGVLCGLYSGPVLRANCFAGYNVRQSGGNTMVTPYVNGTEVGSSYTLLSGHTYTLRIRAHAPEMQRVLQTYYARVDGVIESFGGGLVASPVSLVFEVVDLGDASNTPATVLYDGALASSPASCTFAVVNSSSLTGSMGACSVTQTGSAWIVSTLPGGTKQTRLIGAVAEGNDCTVSATGKVTFMPGRIPVPGELVTILYRTRDRAVARLEDPASVAAEAAGGMPGTARWLGKVIRPVARSSEDCEAAAQTALALATSRAAAIAGSYTALNPEDVWPGDVLAITANGATMSVVVRTVAIVDGHAAPELLTYRVAFANDWAEALGITLSEAIAPDAYLPPAALATPAQVLANLVALTVTSATAIALQIDAGIDTPAGGGFEVRRRDFGFGAGAGQGLVLRSPVRGISIPRSAPVETFYVRMFDASNPPLYSRHSSAVFTNIPAA